MWFYVWGENDIYYYVNIEGGVVNFCWLGLVCFLQRFLDQLEYVIRFCFKIKEEFGCWIFYRILIDGFINLSISSMILFYEFIKNKNDINLEG